MSTSVEPVSQFCAAGGTCPPLINEDGSASNDYKVVSTVSTTESKAQSETSLVHVVPNPTLPVAQLISLFSPPDSVDPGSSDRMSNIVGTLMRQFLQPST